MEHFVRIVMEKQEGAQLLDESIFAEQEIYETEQGATVYEIALPRQLSEDEADEYANKLANYMFEQGYDDFDIEISMNEGFTRNDAIDILGDLRGKGKKIERGTDTYKGNLANEYVSGVWDVYTFLQNSLGISGMSDPKLKEILEPVMQLRGEAKKLETKPGSGENARFGNQIVNALYPLLVYIRDHMEEPKNESIREEYSNVVVKGNNTKIPTVAQQLGWKTEPSVMGREFTTILPDSKPLTKDAVDKFIADLGLKFSSGAHAKNPFTVEEETYDGDDFFEEYGVMWFNEDDELDEAEYQGRKVPLGKPMRGDVKKFKVYVKDPKTGNTKKVNFGDPNMKIKKSNPARRRSFRARHNCDNPGPRTKARYWSCRKW